MSKDDKKPEASLSATELKEALSAALSEGIAMGMAMQSKGSMKPLEPGIKMGATCGKCGQSDMRCRDQHQKMVVFPKNRRHGKFFQGIWLNGVRYLSNNGSHSIWVPKENGIQNLLDVWEDNEDSLLQGRETFHDSGSIGPSGTGFKAAHGGWR